MLGSKKLDTINNPDIYDIYNELKKKRRQTASRYSFIKGPKDWN